MWTKKKLLPVIDALFSEDTMSVHIVQWKTIVRKQGAPWERFLEQTSETRNKKKIEDTLDEIKKHIETTDNAYREIIRKHSEVRQVWEYRIVLVAPPVAPVWEITIVRPLVHLSLEEYNLPESVVTLLWKPWHWVLIAWSPWEWKTTFAQALLQSLDQEKLIIKTIEAPRDVQVWWNVTQYWLAHTTHNEIRDILLLTRPDITLFDEVRNKEDFHLYKDLRLAWVWLIWVMHSTTAVDALQRCIWIIEMWTIPQVIDTVVFIKWWQINEVLTLKQVVKTPVGMQSWDLARPVLIIRSELKDKDIYEIYTYSDNVVVMPLDQARSHQKDKAWIYPFAEHALERQLESILWISARVSVTWSDSITLYVPSWETWRVIWKWWAKIDRLQQELWLSISLKSYEDLDPHDQVSNSNKKKRRNKRKRNY